MRTLYGGRRIEVYFGRFMKSMNGITDAHIVWQATKICASVIPFIPFMKRPN